MKILTRYLIRAHLGPFFFALFALTGLLFVNAVTQRMEDLAGKGLGADVLFEFLKLSLPHTFALTMPMAVLVSVLYAFGELTSSNEVTAMKAGGVAPRRILRPMLWMGVLAAATMLYFNDQVLPESNHQLKNLLYDIARKSPTLELSEQAWNEMRVDSENLVYHLMADRIDNATATMQGIEIVDRNDPLAPRWTFAASGEMAFNESRTDLYLTLYDGVNYEVDPTRGAGFRKIRFEKQAIPLRGVGDELERQIGSERGDREMTVSMLFEATRLREDQLAQYRERTHVRSVQAVRAALGLPTDSSMTALVEQTALRLRAGIANRSPSAIDEVSRGAQLTASTMLGSIDSTRKQLASYQVEIHKKFALSVACIVFVLLGGPLAMRFPRGGLGLVIAASTVIFAVYWAGLIAGEDIADRGFAPASITMWVPNAIFFVIGLWLYRTMGRENSTGRGGGLDEFWWSLRRRFSRRSSAEAVG